MHRIIVAGLIAVTLGSGTLFGLAAATDDVETDAWSALPEFRDGDQFSYQDSRGKSINLTLTSGPYYVAEDGREYPTRLVGDITLDASMIALFGKGSTGHGRSSSSGAESETISYRIVRLSPLSGPCGWHHPLATDYLPASFRLTGSCAYLPEGVDVSLSSETTWRGRSAVVYESADPPVQVTYAAGIPVPVEVKQNSYARTLVGFEPGSQPFADEPRGTALTPLSPAPPSKWGPHGGELNVRVSLQDAFERALADMHDTGVSDFVESHPDWRIVAARMGDKEGPDWWTAFWEFTLQAGQDALVATVWFTADLVEVGPFNQWAEEQGVWSRVAEPRALVAESVNLERLAQVWERMAGGGPLTDVEFDLDPEAWSPMAVGSAMRGQFGASGLFTNDREDPPLRAGVTLIFDHDGNLLEQDHSVTGPPGTVNAGGKAAQPISVAATSVIPVASSAMVAGSIGLAAGLVYYFLPALKAAAPVGLFSRLRPETVQQHPARTQLVNLVKSEPGVHARALARSTGLGNGVLSHHLDALVATGTIVRRDEGGYACFYPDTRRRRPQPKATGAKAIVSAAAAMPGSSRADVARVTGLSDGTISYHLPRLEAAGHIRITRSAAGVQIWPHA